MMESGVFRSFRRGTVTSSPIRIMKVPMKNAPM